MNAKAKGSRNERRAIRILESAGYSCTKSGGSLGVFDIIAVNGHMFRLLQVKSNRPPGPTERECIEQFPVPICTSKEIWVFYDRKHEPAITVVN